MLFRQIVDENLAEYAYLIGCQQTKEALIIDPERDIDRYTAIAEKEGLQIVAVAETHIHADFLSGAREFAERLGTRVYLSDEGDADWKYEWVSNGNYSYQLLRDGDTFQIGNIEIEAVHTPGHTPEHLSYLITDRGGGADEPMGIATGDFVFVGDLGRPDLLESAAGIEGLMEPSARTLYQSLERFYELQDYMLVWPGHGAGSACGKALGAVPETTVGYEKRFNASILAARQGEESFVQFILDDQPEPPPYFARMKRDNKLGPKLLGPLPRPTRMTEYELGALANRNDVAVVDTRLDRSAFMAHHIPGSYYAPFNKSFNTVVGSYVDEGTPIYLVIEEHKVEEAVRDLIRIGLDTIVAFATPNTLERFRDDGGKLASIDVLDFADLKEVLEKQPEIKVLDVRGASEFAPEHVPGALNVAHTRLVPDMHKLDRSSMFYVHCVMGGRSASAAALLRRSGYNVKFVNDEFVNWTDGGEVGTGTASATK